MSEFSVSLTEMLPAGAWYQPHCVYTTKHRGQLHPSKLPRHLQVGALSSPDGPFQTAFVTGFFL